MLSMPRCSVARTLPCLPQRRVLRWVRQLASEQSVLQALEEAGAVPYVVAQLRRQGGAELQVGAGHTALLSGCWWEDGECASRGRRSADG